MQYRAEIRVVATPPDMFAQAWAHCGPMMLKGLAAADVDLREIMDRVVDRSMQLWLILDGYKVVACFLTEIFEADGKKIVGIGGLSGENPGQWCKALTDRIEQFAKTEGATAVRFGGKTGWRRLLPHYDPIGKDGAAEIFERAVQ